MSTSLDQWQDLTDEIKDPLDQQVDEVEVDDDEEDYSVATRHTLATNPMFKIVACGSGVLVVVLAVLAVFIGASSSGNVAKKQQQQQIAGLSEQQKSTLSDSDKKMVEDILARETFNRQKGRQKLLDQRRQKGTAPAPNNRSSPPKPANTVPAPRVVYRPAPPPSTPVARATPAPQPSKQFTIQRPTNVAASPEEIEDPNAGYFTAPFVASSKSSTSTEKRPLLKLTKSPGFDKNKSLTAAKPPTSYTPPVQVASNSPNIPQPQKDFGTLSGNLTNPYVSQVATASTRGGLTIPADTAIDAEIINRVSWIPENTGLAMGKVLRLKLTDDIKSSSGQSVASKGDIALGTVTQATEQGLITVSLTKIGEKFIQQGAVEIHQNGDPTMLAKLHKKGGNNGFWKTALDIGVGGAQTWASNLANPTNQTSITNGDQTFLSSSGSKNNTAASLVEGATAKIGEHLKSSTEGPTQTSIGVFRFDGKVQLYFTREVQL